jgi:hypothetical protein
MKALHVKGARSEDKVFVPLEVAMTESRVFPPMPVDDLQATVVAAKVGLGYLAYVGDVNGEQDYDEVFLALCGLT